MPKEETAIWAAPRLRNSQVVGKVRGDFRFPSHQTWEVHLCTIVHPHGGLQSHRCTRLHPRGGSFQHSGVRMHADTHTGHQEEMR